MSIQLTAADMESLSECPGCRSNDLSGFHEISHPEKTLGSRLSYDFCRGCSLIFMNPRPKQAWYDDYYKGHFWEGKSLQAGYTVTANKRAATTALLRAQKLIGLLGGRGIELKRGCRILEIGCAYGLLVTRLAKEHDGMALGVEPSDEARETANRIFGVELIGRYMADLGDARFQESVDAVVFSHCLENIVDLHGVIAAVRHALRPDGLLVIETPNVVYSKPMHVHHPYCFTQGSLSSLLKEHGIEPVAALASGQPKSVLSPRYATVVGRKSENLQGPALGRSHPLGIRLGQTWHRLLKSTPLGHVDGALTARRYSLDAESKRLLAMLA